MVGARDLQPRRSNRSLACSIAVCGAVLVAAHGGVASAESTPSERPTAKPSFHPWAPSLGVNLGMIQPLLLGGANLEVDFRIGHIVIGYSHGWSLDLEGSTITGEMRTQKVSLHLPYSTGFGVGYSRYASTLNSFFDVRLEGKIHRFEAAYSSPDGATKTAIANYSTYTLGAGAYWTYVPFAGRQDALRGLNVSTSVRLWPRLASSLSDDKATYANASTGRTETHDAANIGIANTPLIVNLSVGYIFQ
jgi:hypothetical protein